MTQRLISFPKVLLAVGMLCLALAGWSFIQGEIRDAIFGLGLAALLLLYWRRELGRRRKLESS